MLERAPLVRECAATNRPRNSTRAPTANSYCASMPTDLTLRTPTTALTTAEAWQRLADDERRRRAAAAANTHDPDGLADLTIAYLSLHGRASAPTIRNYRAAIARFVLAWRDAGENLLRPTRDAGHLYVRQLEVTYAAATVRVHLAAVAALYRALRWAGATEAHPFADVRVVKPDARRTDEKRDAFTEPELARMLDVAAPVDAALVLLGARGGLRLAEALTLTWSDVHLTASPATLTVRNGKGGRDRTVLLVPELVDALEAHKEGSVHGGGNETAGEQGTDHVLPYRSAERARERLRRLQQRANIPLVSGRAIHSLRHSAGTAVYTATNDLVAVQAWLGHATIATSRGYVHRSQRATLAAVAEALPRIKKP